MPLFSLNVQAILNASVSISIFDRRNYTGMFKKLLALGAAGIAMALSTLTASACGCGCGCGLGLGIGCLPGWWGPVAAMGWPFGLFGVLGGCGCGCGCGLGLGCW